jgi:phosphomevalonate kinase
VLSGAYAVLEGAPALVTAVDRYVVADSDAEPPLVTDEVAAAIAQGAIERAPGFDASALREKTTDGDRKLGLGSSAAIVAASIAALWLDGANTVASDDDFPQRVLAAALAAHRAAQPGGSGIDVAASCLGGVLRCQLRGDALDCQTVSLPDDLHVTVYVCQQSASTQHMLAAVHAFRDRDATSYRDVIGAISRGAEQALAACTPADFVAAQRVQYQALSELGSASGVDIVTSEVAALDALAREEGACVGPSGAGGGDIALRFGERAPSAAFAAQVKQLGLRVVGMHLGAPGVSGVAEAT